MALSAVAARKNLAVPIFCDITKNPRLRRIMYHEFPSYRSGQMDLDEAPLRRYIANLSMEQQKFLAMHKLGKDKNGSPRNNRLVLFMTKDPSISKLMGADLCDYGATSVRSNGSLAAFHCRPNERPVLVCYTEELFLNHIPPGLVFQSRTTPWEQTAQHRICAMQDIPTDAWVVWHRICRPDGADIMPGTGNKAPNSLHGMINTVGCWMLFRNYNWPKADYAEFERCYRECYRGRKQAERYDRLAALGYCGLDGKATDSTDQKFWGWDQNFAYSWFTHDLVGIGYFSRTGFHNDYNVDGKNKVPEYPASERWRIPPDNNAHDGDQARKKNPRFVMTNALLAAGNALGFQPADELAMNNGAKVWNVERSSWADVVFYGT